MSSIPGFSLLHPIAKPLHFRLSSGRRSRFPYVAPLTLFLVLLTALCGAKPASAQGFIFVTSLADKVDGIGGCSLQEAIYSANFDDNIAVSSYDVNGTPNFVRTNCLPGNGSDRIILPIEGSFTLLKIVDDIENALGPTATPGIRSVITIEGNGSTLQWGGTQHARAFSIAAGGNLTIRNVYIKGFIAKGGDGGSGGGGGLGAGGAIYVEGGRLTVENSTFDFNRAFGGNGSIRALLLGGGGGGGGLGGNGGTTIHGTLGGNSGGGSRGNGVSGGGGPAAGSGGGGTLRDGIMGGTINLSVGGAGGIACGGTGGNADGGDATSAICPGGGGGGGGGGSDTGRGGNGNYGGGGGGGGNRTLLEDADAGLGGFGGGGGGGDHGGAGGYGGGGGASTGFSFLSLDADPGGPAGKFGGQGGNPFAGGSGAALGGAIFSHNGTVVIQNSTFTRNEAFAGSNPFDSCDAVSCLRATAGVGEGAALFAVNGSLTVQNSTLAGNFTSGTDSLPAEGSGIVVDLESGVPTSFTLENTIIFTEVNDRACFYSPGVQASGSGNLIGNNSGCPGVVSSADPLLGPLQRNSPGLTPTMAITAASPALDAADPATSLASDQRGLDRPQGNGFDIGAFEKCRSLGPVLGDFCDTVGPIKEVPPTAQLTMLVSPPGSGTTAPTTNSFPVGSIIPVGAIPNPGYAFAVWTGPVTDPASITSTVIVDHDLTVTANFAPLNATMFGNIIAKSGVSNARVWTLSLLDNGPGAANSVMIHDFTLTQTFGAACTPVLKNAASFPLLLGNLGPNQTGTTTVALDFTGCAASVRFTAKFTYSANNGAVSGFVTRTNQYQ